MGIKSLSKFLKDTYPDLFEYIHISEYHFKKVAIDTSLYLCKYKALYGEEGWLRAFIKLVACLRENEIHCVFIYDSGYPPEKEPEKKERMEARARLEEKVQKLEEAIDKYHDKGEIDPVLFDFQKKRRLMCTRLLQAGTGVNINAIEYAVKKMRKQLFTITSEDFRTTKELFKKLQVPFFNAPLEAETMCSDLCIRGEVDAVLSEDTDVLAYGAPVFLTDFNTTNGCCMRINYDQVLKIMELTPEQFLDFCIMCGSDYNKNIYRVGPSRALSLVKTHDSIENITMNTSLDTSILNHKRVRELFRKYEQRNIKVPYCGSPDFNDLQLFMTKKNININSNDLKKSFIRDNIVFEETEKSEEIEETEEDKNKGSNNEDNYIIEDEE